MFLLLLNTVGFIVSQEYDFTEMQESQEIQGILPFLPPGRKLWMKRAKQNFNWRRSGEFEGGAPVVVSKIFGVT